MAEKEGKQQGIVNVNGVAAGAIASVVAAFFTSRLGVAGTLIGAAVTSMMITISSAVLNASLSRAARKLSEATTRISGLPNPVRGRLSTQQVRVPGGPGPEPNPLPEAEPQGGDDEFGPRRSRRERRGSGPLAKLRSAFGNFGLLPTSVRRRTLVAGALAGVASLVVALFAITGIETVIGEPLSSWGRGDAGQLAQGGTESGRSGTSVGWLVGGSETNAPSDEVQTEDEQPTGDSLFGTPGEGEGGSETPQDGVVPAPEDPQEGQQPGTPSEEPVVPGEPVTPAPEQPAPDDGSSPAQPLPQQPAPQQPSGEVQQPAVEQ